MEKIKIKIIARKELKPNYKSLLAAGADLKADICNTIQLLPGDSAIIPTGIKMAIPDGYEGEVCSRSGLNFNEDIICPKGTIDADYRGEIRVKLYNLSRETRWIRPLDRIAQLVIKPVVQAEFEDVYSLDETERGENGFGSTGK